MKKSRFVSSLLFVSLLCVLVPATAKAALWEVPAGLNPGDSFRWVFVTSIPTNATSTDIADYNKFVNDVAVAADTTIAGVEGFTRLAQIEWKVIGSTKEVNALDNIQGFATEPVFDPYGTKIEDAVWQMFDGEIKNPILFDEYGNPLRIPIPDPPHAVWTGTLPHGMQGSDGYLGLPEVLTGICDSIDPAARLWSGSAMASTEYLPMYAISGTLTVVPVPGALILAATGMLSATVGLKRLRRKDQE